MKFKYIGVGGFFQGLPATDLDTDLLTPEQLELLKDGVAANLYIPDPAEHPVPDHTPAAPNATVPMHDTPPTMTVENKKPAKP